MAIIVCLVIQSSIAEVRCWAGYAWWPFFSNFYFGTLNYRVAPERITSICRIVYADNTIWGKRAGQKVECGQVMVLEGRKFKRIKSMHHGISRNRKGCWFSRRGTRWWQNKPIWRYLTYLLKFGRYGNILVPIFFGVVMMFNKKKHTCMIGRVILVFKYFHWFWRGCREGKRRLPIETALKVQWDKPNHRYGVPVMVHLWRLCDSWLDTRTAVGACIIKGVKQKRFGKTLFYVALPIWTAFTI